MDRNWLAQKATTNRITSSQSLIIIRSRRKTFIIRNKNKRKENLYLLAKFSKLQFKLTSVAGSYNSSTLRASRVFKQILPVNGFNRQIFQVSEFNRQAKNISFSLRFY